MLERGTYDSLVGIGIVSETHFVPFTFFVLVVTVAVVFSALWSILCTRQKFTSEAPSSQHRSSPQKAPRRTDSVSTLTDTDNETTDAHSLAPHRGVKIHHRDSTTGMMKVETHNRRPRRVRKAVFNPYDDTLTVDDGRWDPWFNPSSW